MGKEVFFVKYDRYYKKSKVYRVVCDWDFKTGFQKSYFDHHPKEIQKEMMHHLKALI